MRLCGSVNWCKIGQWVVLFNLLFVVSIARSQNLPPVVDRGIPNQHAEVNVPFNFTIPSNAFFDLNNQPLTISFSGLPSGISNTGTTLTGNPTTAGDVTVSVQASDGTASVTTTFIIYVHPAGSQYTAFTIDVQKGCGYQIVSFTNKTKGPQGNNNWTLGNGNTSGLTNPSGVIYDRAGVYTVTLTNDQGSFSERITIYPLPEPQMAKVGNDGCEPLTMLLQSTGSPVTIQPFSILGQAVGGITGSTESYYNWYFFERHPEQFTTNKSINISGLNNGIYNVSLEVTDVNGCHNSFERYNLFEVWDRPAASFTFDKANNCSPSLTSFNNTSAIEGGSITGHAWTINSSAAGTSTNLIYDFTSTGAGTYVVGLTETSNRGCISTTYFDTVTFNTNNSADFTFNPAITCLGNPTQFNAQVSSGIESLSWDFNNDGIEDASASNPSWSFTSGGQNPVQLTAVFTDGCIIDVSKDIPAEQVLASFTDSVTSACNGIFTIQLADKSTSEFGSITSRTWSWRPQGGVYQAFSSGLNPTLTISGSGLYEIKLDLVGSTGCAGSTSRIISLSNPLTSMLISGKILGCLLPSEATVFTATFTSEYETAVQYNWNFGDGNIATGISVSHTYLSAGIYSPSLTVVTASGCSITVNRPNAIQLANPPTISSALLDQANHCLNTAISIEVGFSAGTDSLRFYTPWDELTENNPGTSPYAFSYLMEDLGLWSIDIVAIDRGCESAPYTVTDIQIDEPRADFSPSQSTFCSNPPYNVSFTNTSVFTNPGTTFYWDFGDGTNSILENPEHEYATTGQKIISLTVENPVSLCSDSYTDTINIFSISGSANVIQTSDQSICVNDSIGFSINNAIFSGNFSIATYEWDFDNNGIIDSYVSNPQWAYPSPGNYTVSVHIIGTGGCNYFFSENGFISVSGPVPAFTTSSPTCLNTPVLFTNQTVHLAGNTYAWTFGDGWTSTQQNPQYTYTNDSTYSVSLTVVDAGGCSSTLIKEDLITIDDFRPSFTLPDTIACGGSTFRFTNTSTGAYNRFVWDFGNGVTTTTNNLNPVDYSYPNPGTYQPTLTMFSPGGCSLTYSATIRVINANASFSELMNGEIGCAPASANFIPAANPDEVVSYLWNFGDGFTSNEREPRHRYFRPDRYAVTLQIEFKGGCTDTKSNFVNVKGAYGELAFDKTVGCLPNTVHFTASNMRNVNYISWDFGPEGITDTIADYTVPATSEYTYTFNGYQTPRILLTSLECGTKQYAYWGADSIYTSIPPVAAFGADNTAICQGIPIRFTDQSDTVDARYPASQWKWIFASTHSVSDTAYTQNTEYTYNTPGGFAPQLIVSNAIECSDTVTGNVNIFDINNVRSSYDADDFLPCPNQSVNFTGSGSSTNGPITSWFWDFRDGTIANTRNFDHAFDDSQRGKRLNVLFVATDDKRCSDSTFHAVAINNLQVVPYYEPQLVYRDHPVDFFDLSTSDFGTSVMSRTWTFETATPPVSTLQTQNDVRFPTIGNNFRVTLEVHNNNNCSSDTTFFLNILNNLPIAEDFTIKFFEGIIYTFRRDSFEANFSSQDPGQFLESIRITSTPDFGTLWFNGAQVTPGDTIPASQIHLLTYHPPLEWNGSASFQWSGNDGMDFGNSATVTIIVLPEPDPPTPGNITFNVAENEVVQITYNDFSTHFTNPTFPDFLLDSMQIVSLINSLRSELRFNGSAVITGRKFSREELQMNSFSVTLPQGYNEGTVFFLWNGYDSLKWGTTPARVVINYINAPPVLAEIVRSPLIEDAIQTIQKAEFDAKYSDTDAPHDQPQRVFLVVPSGVQGTFKINKTIYGVGQHSILYSAFDSIQYIPPVISGGFNGSVNFQWGASDGQDTTFANIRFDYINTPPVAHDITVSGNEDNNLAFLTAQFASKPEPFEDIDANDNLDSIRIESLPANGTLTFRDVPVVAPRAIKSNEINFRLSFIPNPNWFGTTSFTYRSFDGTNWSNNVATVWITITPVNDPPVALNDTIYTQEDIQTLSYNVILSNDQDIDDIITDLRVSILDEGTAGAKGTIELQRTGELIYTPDRDSFGTVSFTYSLCDTSDACSVATVIINVTAVNDPPVATDDVISILETTIPYISVDTTNLLYNDIDPEGDRKAIISIETLPPGTILNGLFGDLVVSDDGRYTYTLHSDIDSLAEGETVTDRFAYVVADQPAGDAASAWLIINIIGVNSPPEPTNDFISVDENKIINYNPAFTLLDNDSDPEGDLIHVSAIDGVSSSIIDGTKGYLQWLSNGQFYYKQGLLYNNLFDYLPEGASANVDYTYTLSDGRLSADGHLIITINGLNDAPIADDDSLIFPLGADSIEVINTHPASFRVGDWDPDNGDSFWIINVNDSTSTTQTTSVGTLKWDPAGGYIYIPNQDSIIKLQYDEFAVDIFTYVIQDGLGATDTATLTITIWGLNDNPVSLNDTLTILEDQFITNVLAPGLLSNDSDPEYDPIVVAIDGQNSGQIIGDYGTLDWDSTGAYTYTSDIDLVNTFPKDSVFRDVFTYTIKDTVNGFSHANLYIEIIGQNDAPVALDNTEAIQEGDVLERLSPEEGLLNNDTDIDRYDTIHVLSVEGDISSETIGSFGILHWEPDGTYTYTLNPETDTLSLGEMVTDTFLYQITDLHDSTAVANLIITITGKNSIPVAVSDHIEIMEDVTIREYLLPNERLLANDYDADGDTFWMITMKNQILDSVNLVYCSIKWDSTGAFTYFRNPELDTLAIGTEVRDSVQYRITDTNGAMADAWLYIRIIGENDAPVAVRDDVSILETTSSYSSDQNTNLLANDSDIDQNDSISVISVANDTLSVSPGIYGELWWLSDGSYTYYNNALATDTLQQDEVVFDIFPYTISDLETATSTNELRIKINGVNDKPVAINDTLWVQENDLSDILTAGTDGLLDNDLDTDKDDLLVVNFDNAVQNTYDTDYGTISWNNAGTIQFIPRQASVDSLGEGETVYENFQYVVSDSYENDTALLTVIISGENDVPIALNDSVSIFEDRDSISGEASDFSSLLSNDDDIDGDSVIISLINNLSDRITPGNYGRVEWDSLGNYTYYTYREITDTLAQDEIVYDVFQYTLTDIYGATTNASLIISITGINDPPIAFENRYYTKDRLPVTATAAPLDTANILFNDVDVDSHDLRMVTVNESSASTTTGNYGTIVWNTDGSFNYQPDSAKVVPLRPLQTVVDTFSYSMEDDYLAADTSLLHFIIEGINNPPIARNDTLFVFEDNIFKALPAPGLLVPKNVEDPDHDTLLVFTVAGSNNDSIPGRFGYLKWDSTGNVVYFTYQHIIHQLGYGEVETETFSYTIIDEGDLTAKANLLIKIIGENDPVIANNDTTQIEEDSYVRYNVVENDTDIDFNWEGNFDFASLTILEMPKHGKASRNSVNGEIYYFPEKDFYGTDSIQYRICDTGDSVYCDDAWFYIEVMPVNDPPVATHLVLRTPMNTAVSFDYAAQITDVDDGVDPNSLTLPNNNKLSVNNEFIIYTPVPNFTGIDEFIYSMKDYSNAAAYVIVTVIVGDTTSGFTAQNDTIITPEDTPVDINVLVNDTLGGEFPDPRTIQIKVFPLHGMAVFDPIKQIINYKPDENFNGTDSLTYIVSSGPGNWSFANVYITVTPFNDPIIANDDYAETKIAKAIVIPVLYNDSDPDNRINLISIITQPQHGTPLLEPNGNIRYIPDADFTGIDTLTYGICDTLTEVQECDSALVIIIVTGDDKLFEAVNDNYVTNENTPKELVPAPDANDINNELPVDPASLSIISGPLHGDYTVLTDIITYNPETGYFGPDWMQYIISDTEGNWDMAEINIWVNEMNNPPVAVNDTVMVTRNAYSRFFVLENDYDTDGTLDWSTLLVVNGNGPVNGTAVVDPQTGTIMYKPSINSGVDHFTYRICDNKGACTEGTVYITIELETRIYIWKNTPEDTPLTIDIAAKMAEYNLTFTITDIIEELKPDLGTYTFMYNNRDLVYTPLHDLIGKDTILLNVWSADHTEFAYLRIYITILPVNDAPVALADTLTWIDAPDTLIVSFNDLLQNDYDVDGDTLSFTQKFFENGFIDKGYSGLQILVDNSDSTITITADTILWCDAWFSYEITDGNGLTDTAMVYIWPELSGITAFDDSDSVDENSSSNLIDVLVNDAFVDNQRCTIDSVIIVTPPQHGIAIGTTDNFVNYAPTRHYFGIDSLEYQIIDIWGQSSAAWLYIDVIQKNSPPVAVTDDTISTFGAVISIPVLYNDYDPDAISYTGSPGDPDAFIDSARTHITIGSFPLHGTVVFDQSTYNFIYTPDVTSCEPDSFQYTIYDNEGDSATAWVIITMTEASVTAVIDIQKAYPGIPVDVEPLLNDEGFFVPEYTVYTETYPVHGNITWSTDNIVTYTSNKDYIGRDSILYTIVSPCGNETSAWIIFKVEELRVPEIITPNGDGKNDVLIIDGIEYFPDNLLQIYNRYGHIVYEKKRYDNTWDGHSNKGSLFGNKPLPAGTYYYTLIYNEGRNRQAGFIYIFL